MITLYRKEINSFFSNPAGYVVLIVFLLANSLFMWVFKGDLNVLDAGHANLDTLFLMAPWIFLFLVPAVTMRIFAEEKRSGTLDLLLSQPITELKIVLAKYLAAVTLVLFSLLPTLVYYISVHRLGSPPGNLDTGAIAGSYIGLLMLGSAYAAIGVFTSALSENQIISFILSVLLCFLLYTGFDLLVTTDLFGNLDVILLKLGINEHYKSISRGVLDTRDVLYFLSLISFFLLLTRVMLLRSKW